jgi:hypothetical protein
MNAGAAFAKQFNLRPGVSVFEGSKTKAGDRLGSACVQSVGPLSAIAAAIGMSNAQQGGGLGLRLGWVRLPLLPSRTCQRQR